MKKKLLKAFGAAVLAATAFHANAALYTNSFGSLVPGYFQNDDSVFGPINLGFSLNLFGTSYSSFYASNNGLVSFGGPVSSYTSVPLNTQTDGVLIAPYWTDLYSANGPADSGVYLSQTAEQTVVTWNDMGYYPTNYSGTATFQLVLNSNGQIGFYYGDMSSGNDTHNASAGFGDGLSTINPGELSSATGTTSSVSSQLNQAQYLFTVANGVPQETPNDLPEPTTTAMFGLGMLSLVALRKRSK